MGLELFHLLDVETIDDSVLKGRYNELYHQQGAHLNNCDQNMEFIFAEINNYHQREIEYFQYDVTA